jgi:hypothetical protein
MRYLFGKKRLGFGFISGAKKRVGERWRRGFSRVKSFSRKKRSRGGEG